MPPSCFAGALGRFDSLSAGPRIRQVLRSRPRPSAARPAETNRSQIACEGRRDKIARWSLHATLIHRAADPRRGFMARPEAPTGEPSVDLKGQTAIVTGALRGLVGRSPWHFGKSGANVACVARNAEKLKETVDAMIAAGGDRRGLRVRCNGRCERRRRRRAGCRQVRRPAHPGE